MRSPSLLRKNVRTRINPGAHKSVKSVKSVAKMVRDFHVLPSSSLSSGGWFTGEIERLYSLVDQVMVFGSAGHRDRAKRPDMGRVAGRYCDVLILTEEDPRTENAMDIAREIAAGVERPEVEIHMVEDRVEAIGHAIKLARSQDIVLITGKGDETELEVQHPTTWVGDAQAAVQALQKLLQDPSRRSIIA